MSVLSGSRQALGVLRRVSQIRGAAVSQSSCVGFENEFTLDCWPFASLSPTQTSGQRRWKQYDREEGD